MPIRKNEPTPPTYLWTVKQGRQLGLGSRQTVTKLIRNGDIQAIRIGRSVMITDQSVRAFIARQSEAAP